MSLLQAVIVAAIPSSAAVASAWLGFRDLGLRRRLETSRQFVNLFASAHGRPLDGRQKPIGVGEQVATIHLIADFAAREKVLINAAIAGLRNLETWDRTLPAKPAELDLADLEGKVPDDQLQMLETVLGRATDTDNTDGLQKIASAARAALARLEPRMKPDHLVSVPRVRIQEQ